MKIQPAPSITRSMRGYLPQGRLLPEPSWKRRHQAILVVLWLHVPGLLAFGLLRGTGLLHAAADVVPIAVLTLVAHRARLGRRLRSIAAATALVTCSAMLVHLWDGTIEAHFHFFVIIGLLVLYQDWPPFLLALLYVILHHGLVGTIDPQSVYGHSAAAGEPWAWAGIHALFVLAASVTNVVAWRVNEQALHEPLTGLPGRPIFLDRVEQALARLERRPGAIAVLFIDLDRFKIINDSLGHEAGDRLLVATAQRLRGVLRREDSVARLGGDEFAILCHDIDDEHAVVGLARRLTQVVAEPVLVDGRQIHATASLGIAITSDPAYRVSDLMRDADVAMYRSKERGGGAVQVFDASMHERVVRRMEVEADLRGAQSRGELRLVYQPELCLLTGEIVGVEALLRWDHPVRGPIPPSEFIPIAEETNLIIPIGRWVLEEACRQASEWRERLPGRPPLRMRVNVSPRQLNRPDLPDVVTGALRAEGMDPDDLDLELTESAIMGELDWAIVSLQALKRIGVRLSIDDFGTGHSSLAHLKRFPVDTLKLDRSFVAEMEATPRDAALVGSIIDMAHALGLSVTAEGIELPAQLERLKELGCDHAQGFHLGRPMGPDDVCALVSGSASALVASPRTP